MSSSPEGRGWLFSLEVEEAGEVEAMMDLQQYTDYLRWDPRLACSMMTMVLMMSLITIGHVMPC